MARIAHHAMVTSQRSIPTGSPARNSHVFTLMAFFGLWSISDIIPCKAFSEWRPLIDTDDFNNKSVLCIDYVVNKSYASLGLLCNFLIVVVRVNKSLFDDFIKDSDSDFL